MDPELEGLSSLLPGSSSSVVSPTYDPQGSDLGSDLRPAPAVGPQTSAPRHSEACSKQLHGGRQLLGGTPLLVTPPLVLILPPALCHKLGAQRSRHF